MINVEINFRLQSAIEASRPLKIQKETPVLFMFAVRENPRNLFVKAGRKSEFLRKSYPSTDCKHLQSG